jgi:hypothetical protein
VVGIERDPAYCQYASRLAETLSLPDVTFINADARDVDLNSGTIFYLFTPFVASILHTVMEKIRCAAHQHPVLVCSFGPCTPELASLTWLKKVSPDCQHEFKLAIFRADEETISQNPSTF